MDKGGKIREKKRRSGVNGLSVRLETAYISFVEIVLLKVC